MNVFIWLLWSDYSLLLDCLSYSCKNSKTNICVCVSDCSWKLFILIYYFSSLLKSLITEEKDATKSWSCSRKSWSVKDKNHQKQCGNTKPAAASYSSFISKWMTQDYPPATSSFSNDLYVLKSCYLMRLFNTEHTLKTPSFFVCIRRLINSSISWLNWSFSVCARGTRAPESEQLWSLQMRESLLLGQI